MEMDSSDDGAVTVVRVAEPEGTGASVMIISEAVGAFRREMARRRRSARSAERGGPAGTRARCLSPKGELRDRERRAVLRAGV